MTKWEKSSGIFTVIFAFWIVAQFFNIAAFNCNFRAVFIKVFNNLFTDKGNTFHW